MSPFCPAPFIIYSLLLYERGFVWTHFGFMIEMEAWFRTFERFSDDQKEKCVLTIVFAYTVHVIHTNVVIIIIANYLEVH